MRADIVAEAQRWLGTPYRHQAALRGAGCDCLGLVRGIWQAVYGREPMAVPAYGPDWRGRDGEGLQAAAEHVLTLVELPFGGEVVLFRLLANRPPRHCGVMLGPETFIHAQEGVGVVEAHMSAPWARRVAGYYQFPETGA